MCSILETKNNIEYSDSLNHILKSIQNGDSRLKEEFINDYKLFIIKTVSNVLGYYIDDKNNEEYSVGLQAFNEAIDHHTAKENSNFLKYSEIIIHHRIIDYIRKNKKNTNVLPFSYFDEYEKFEERYLKSNAHYQYENIEIKEELTYFRNQLNQFGISLEELVSESPKHKDAKQRCIDIATIINENQDLYQKMMRKKCIPMTDLLKRVKVHERTIERNRKYVIAVTLLLRSNLEVCKDLLKDVEGKSKKIV